MLKNLLLTAFRNLKRDTFFSLLNIMGLTFGMAVFLLIAQYVRFERSYENFITEADNIYRVTLESYNNNELTIASAENYPGVGPALKNEFPEVRGYARLYNMGYKNNVVITREDAKPDPIAIKQRRFLYADSALLTLMGYPMISGDPRTALQEPFSAVISEKYAKLYFGNEDPIGKTLRLNDDDANNELVKVTGVFRELPLNTHLKFDLLFSYKTLYNRGDFANRRYNLSWTRSDMYTFILLAPGTSTQAMESKFPAIVAKYSPDLKEKHQKDILKLQRLKDIHLTSNLAEESEPNGDSRLVMFLGLIGIFVLAIAWINYINLSTAKAMDRAREVGVRKVMGAFKNQLINQFLMESALINFLSLTMAIVLALLLLPYFNSLSGLALSYSYFIQPWFIGLLGTLWLTGSLLSGIYPAFVLSSFKPITVLKGKLKNSHGGIYLREALVVVQIAASLALIAGTITIYRQLHFMMDLDLGVNINQVLVVERPGVVTRDRKAFHSAIDVFRDELKKSPTLQAFATSVTVPGKQREYKTMIKKYGAPDDQQVTMRINSMDYDFVNVYKMKLMAGRLFSEEFTHDQDTSIIVSESGVRLLGYKKPEEIIGQTITVPEFDGWSPIVVGVVNDYHQVSLKKPLEPTLFYCTKYDGEFYSLRVSTNNLTETIDHVRKSWEKAFPGNPFEYFFLDDYFNKQYENERKFGSLFTSFAALAVIIGCLGLFGLSAYTASQRTKEIGIRKVLGSTVSGIFILLSSQYLKLIAISIVVSTPLIWWVMKNWIESFPYRANISFEIFLASGIAVIFVSALTVSFQTFKAAKTNPVDSLRHE